MNCGLYELRNTANGKRYVGSTAHLSVRFLQHRSLLRRNLHSNAKLQSAWNKHGESAFAYKVIVVLEPCDLVATEQRLLDQMHRLGESNYNIAPFDNSGAKGRSPSAATRAKQSASVRATYDAPGKREQHAKLIKQRHADPDYAKRNGDALKNAWAALDEATKQKHIAARRAPCDTVEAREKLSQLLALRYSDPEYKARHAAACKKANADPERLKKLSIAATGRKLSDSTKQKLSDANKKAWLDPAYREKMLSTKAAALAARAVRNATTGV